MKDRPTAWITGAQGLIGSELVRSAPLLAPQFEARCLSREVLDLLDHRSVRRLFHQERPALIIHCAALSKNPTCEADPSLADQMNVGVTASLLELGMDIPFVFFSTDLVFDGTKGDYVEGDAPNPLSVYAGTKVRAEERVRKHPRHTIFRLSLTGGNSGAGGAFNEEMKAAWAAGKTLHLFTDEFRCPASAEVIARSVWEVIRRDAIGTFHLCGAERLSRFEIGQALAARHPELRPTIRPAFRREYQGPPRPADTSMNCAKLQALLPFALPRFTEWLTADRTGF